MTKNGDHDTDLEKRPSVKELIDVFHEQGYDDVISRLDICIKKENGLQFADYSEIDTYLETEINLVTTIEKIHYLELLSPEDPIVIKWGMKYAKNFYEIIDEYKRIQSCVQSTFSTIIETSDLPKLANVLENMPENLIPKMGEYLEFNHLSKIFENTPLLRIEHFLKTPTMSRVVIQKLTEQQLNMLSIVDKIKWANFPQTSPVIKHIQEMQKQTPRLTVPVNELLEQFQKQTAITSELTAVINNLPETQRKMLSAYDYKRLGVIDTNKSQKNSKKRKK